MGTQPRSKYDAARTSLTEGSGRRGSSAKSTVMVKVLVPPAFMGLVLAHQRLEVTQGVGEGTGGYGRPLVKALWHRWPLPRGSGTRGVGRFPALRRVDALGPTGMRLDSGQWSGVCSCSPRPLAALVNPLF